MDRRHSSAVAQVVENLPPLGDLPFSAAGQSPGLAAVLNMASIILNHMAIMTGNPALNQNTFTDVQSTREGDAMTIQGTVNKTSILLVLVVVAASFTWRM